MVGMARQARARRARSITILRCGGAPESIADAWDAVLMLMRLMRLAARSRALAHQARQPVGAKPDGHAVGPDRHLLDQQLHDPRLLGREQLVPERVELRERLAHLGLGDVRRLLRARRARCRR